MLDAQVTGSEHPETEPAAAIELLILVPTFGERKNVPGIVDGLDRTLKGVGWEDVFDRDQVVDAVFRLRNAQHVVDLGFEENNLTPHESPCPGVLLCDSQIYPMDRGTTYAVRDGNEMAARLRERRRAASATAAPAAASRESAEAA